VHTVTILKYTLCTSILIFLVDLIGGFISRCSLLIGDSLQSLFDIVILLMLIVGLAYSEKPADLDHPYGHGKIKYLAMYTVALIIIFASILLILNAVEKLKHIERIEYIALPIAITALSMNIARSSLLYLGYTKTREIVLLLEFKHVITDLAGSILIFIGICLSFSHPVIDPIGTMMLAMYLMYIASKYLKESIHPLIDTVSSNYFKEIVSTLKSLSIPTNIEVSEVRIRNIGGEYVIDLKIKAPKSYTIDYMHKIAKNIEYGLKARKRLRVKHVNVVSEPY